MSGEELEPQRRGKDEKQEKEDEKQEKSFEEKWRRDPIDAATWALILIWAGLVLLAANLGLFERLETVEGWDIFFIGAGVLLLLQVGARLLFPAYRQPFRGTLILAVVFLGIGLSGLVTWNWGVIVGLGIIIIGLSLLLGGLRRPRQ
jgi:hypothetical protein